MKKFQRVILKFLAMTAIVLVPGVFLARDSMAAIAPTTGCCVMTATNTCKVNQIEANCQSPNQFLSGIPDCRQNGLEIPACKAGRIISPSVAENPNVPTPKKTAPLTFTPNVPIPGLFDEKNIPIDETFFGGYVSSFYIFFAGVAGILAVVVMMWGGFHYITSAGNPQKMKQGQEIISNAVIGLILVLTSYVLLRTINPNLLSLNLTSLSYVPQILQTQRYCEAQGANAVAAAVAQGKYCGSQTEVEYTDENGVQKKCVPLRIADQNLRDQEYACFPVRKIDEKTGQYTLNFEAMLATKICDEDKYTPDKLCNYTQNIFRFQDWLKGACKGAVVAGGKDGQCKYSHYFSCDEGRARISCNAGEDRNTPCWSKGKPRQYTALDSAQARLFGIRQNITSVCLEPDPSNPPVELIDGICCRNNVKDYIYCRDIACNDNEVEVECGPFNNDTSKNFPKPPFGLSSTPKCNEDRTNRQHCCAPMVMQISNSNFPGLRYVQ